MKKSLYMAIAIATLGASSAAQAQGTDLPDFRLSPKTFFQQSSKFKGGRKVFAWYMVCCGPAVGGWELPRDKKIAAYKAEILEAQSMGIDGFGLDIMQPNEAYHEAIDALFTAAKELNSGFKLFLECDYGKPDGPDYVTLIKKYHQHPNYETYKGVPLVCAYGADCIKPTPQEAVAFWKDEVISPLAAAGIKIHFVPGTFHKFGNSPADKNGWVNLDKDVAGWGDVADGHSAWQIQTSPIGGGKEALERFAKAAQDQKKTWMSTVAIHYWWGAGHSVPSWYWQAGEELKPDKSNRNAKYYEHAGGQGLDAQWQSVIETQHPEWVMMLTWNDYNESYFQPIDDYKKYKNGTASGAPLGWYKPQVGMCELSRYFIQWYKTGVKPKITNDSLFYAYFTHSYKIKAEKDPRPPVEWGNPPASDSLYLTTALTAPATLRVSTGGEEKTYEVAAGLSHTVVPFRAGKQAFSLWRKGKQVSAIEGEPVVDKVDFYDYWPTTGFVLAK